MAKTNNANENETNPKRRQNTENQKADLSAHDISQCLSGLVIIVVGRGPAHRAPLAQLLLTRLAAR